MCQKVPKTTKKHTDKINKHPGNINVIFCLILVDLLSYLLCFTAFLEPFLYSHQYFLALTFSFLVRFTYILLYLMSFTFNLTILKEFWKKIENLKSQSQKLIFHEISLFKITRGRNFRWVLRPHLNLVVLTIFENLPVG